MAILVQQEAAISKDLPCPSKILYFAADFHFKRIDCIFWQVTCIHTTLLESFSINSNEENYIPSCTSRNLFLLIQRYFSIELKNILPFSFFGSFTIASAFARIFFSVVSIFRSNKNYISHSKSHLLLYGKEKQMVSLLETAHPHTIGAKCS